MSENEFKAISGHAEHQVGESITYHDQWALSGRNSGRILHIIWPDRTHDLTYVVAPDIGNGKPREVAASAVIE